MSIRRGLMMGMANGSKIMSGEFTPTQDVGTVDINIGFSPKYFYITVTDLTLVSGKRQFISLAHVDNNGAIYECGTASNSTVSSISTCYSRIPSSANFAVSANGGNVTIDATVVISGNKFLSGVTYKWFAYV